MRKKFPELALFLFFLISMTAWFSGYLYQRSAAEMLSDAVAEKDSFRKMSFTEDSLIQIAEASQAAEMSLGEIMTVLYPFSPEGFSFFPQQMDPSALRIWRSRLLKYNRSGYLALRDAYAAVWDDVACFPVTGTEVSYENTWMFERTYGGLRGHEGTDLIPAENLTDVYPVVSMTDGVVENIGWLEQGGYRIGIRSLSGGYFYYAHLSSYARDFETGDSVYAGERLGLMGDSGYGEEGTVGQFAVHLHLGIYIQTGQSEELSVNPYWVLRYLELQST